MISNTKLNSSNGNLNILSHVPTVLYKNRYCNQDDVSVLVCGGQNENGETLKDVYELKGPNFKSNKFPFMLEARWNCKKNFD